MAEVRRLVKDIIPARYELAIDMNDQAFEFGLDETIEFELKRASKTLDFHALDLKVKSAKLDGKLEGRASYDRDEHLVTFTFEDEVTAGQHTLKLTVAGEIQDSLHGFYRSEYGQGEHEGRFFMTQFEAIHAREAFVCIDEPAAKAVFEVSLTVPDEAGYTVLGNTPELSDVTRDGRRTVRFEPTPKMSTYLLAWVVSQLASVEGKAKSGVMVRIFATPQYAGQLDYALDFARRSLDFYEDYFAIPYPLPKLDLVACPNFASGAMENWGLVTYRETDLLVDKANTSLGQKQRVSEVIAHELAHQWFGNLVTMSWWEDLWLNESFASWAETLTVDTLEPTWLWWANYTAGLGAYAREIDALANTHPILVEVPDPKGLDEIFDAISYFKGQGLLRMLEGYLGAEAMRDGLRLYLDRHKYGNTVTDDLWAALSEASGKDVAGLMHAWTLLPGFPLLSYEDGLVKQERFVASPREAKKLAAAGEAPVWPVPWAAVLPGGRRSEKILADQDGAELPEAVVSADWFKPNPDEQSFVRSTYTESIIAALQQPLQQRTLGVADRFGVVSDVWATTAAGRTSSKAALDLTAALRDEPEFIAALAVYDGFGSLLSIVEPETERRRLEAVGQWLAEPNFQRLGWDVRDGESHFDTLLRPVALNAALRFDVPGAKEEALKRFADYAAGGQLDPNVRTPVLFGAARYGAAEQYEQMLALYRKEEAPHTRQAQLVHLGRFTQPELAHRTLEFALSNEVRLQDTVYGLAGVWRARDNREIAWQFLQDNWDELVRRFGEGGHMLDRFPGFPGDAFSTHAKAKEVREFFAAHPHVLITRPVAQAVESIEMRADWYDRDRQDIAWFLDQWEASRQ
ncbi:MAG TPA: M1 family metallopeptidase [Candidatus Saccharimonadia bacterium]